MNDRHLRVSQHVTYAGGSLPLRQQPGEVMRRIATMAGATVLAAMLACATPSAVSACVSGQPSFAEAVRGARAIARVTVVEGWDGYQDDPTQGETYRVERVLKGSLPKLVTVAPAWTTLCHDSV